MEGSDPDRPDAAPEAVDLVCALHSSDRPILFVCNPLFRSREEMNQHLLGRRREPVGAADTTICLGYTSYPDARRVQPLVFDVRDSPNHRPPILTRSPRRNGRLNRRVSPTNTWPSRAPQAPRSRRIIRRSGRLPRSAPCTSLVTVRGVLVASHSGDPGSESHHIPSFRNSASPSSAYASRSYCSATRFKTSAVRIHRRPSAPTQPAY